MKNDYRHRPAKKGKGTFTTTPSPTPRLFQVGIPLPKFTHVYNHLSQIEWVSFKGMKRYLASKDRNKGKTEQPAALDNSYSVVPVLLV